MPKSRAVPGQVSGLRDYEAVLDLATKEVHCKKRSARTRCVCGAAIPSPPAKARLDDVECGPCRAAMAEGGLPLPARQVGLFGATR